MKRDFDKEVFECCASCAYSHWQNIMNFDNGEHSTELECYFKSEENENFRQVNENHICENYMNNPYYKG